MALIVLRLRNRRTKRTPLLTGEQKIQRFNYIFIDEAAIRNLEITLYHSRFPATFPEALKINANYKTKIMLWSEYLQNDIKIIDAI
ncbi:hypothetical protein BpHYR1_025371 [Brachionus plicatilis]|uniref:Uncharacterized protein n=1 Tax=Brachionus plicatilis TaxID=10195 RepID=A0A3M7PUA4_BRAPC|nr:hypothetical protein BpHYR1_025371 [Brachionus plicatilis]